VRQGEVASQGKWTGPASGGVTAPDSIILPDPAQRFADTAARLEVLATGHAMEDWLRFLARLAQAQHEAATSLPPPAGIDSAIVGQAVEARMPPIAADGHRREPVWQNGLALILRQFEDFSLPDRAMAVIADLRGRDSQAVETLATAFLHGDLNAGEVGHALYVAAALQVYFTRIAASLSATALRLLEQRGLCPCCGSTPVSGLITASGPTPGTRYLVCSLCSAAWNHVRVVCITCSESRAIVLEGIDGDGGSVKAETCGDCHTYAKMLYQMTDTKVDPFADDLATLTLDVLMAEAGWSRHAANPFLLVG
jgi:FdhE protein